MKKELIFKVEKELVERFKDNEYNEYGYNNKMTITAFKRAVLTTLPTTWPDGYGEGETNFEFYPEYEEYKELLNKREYIQELARICGVEITDGKKYAAECRKVAKIYRLPFEVVLSVGPDGAKAFKEDVDTFVYNRLPKLTVEEIAYLKHLLLRCGIDRRKEGLVFVINPDKGDIETTGWVNSLGQIGSRRLARYIASRLPRGIKSSSEKNIDNTMFFD